MMEKERGNVCVVGRRWRSRAQVFFVWGDFSLRPRDNAVPRDQASHAPDIDYRTFAKHVQNVCLLWVFFSIKALVRTSASARKMLTAPRP